MKKTNDQKFVVISDKSIYECDYDELTDDCEIAFIPDILRNMLIYVLAKEDENE